MTSPLDALPATLTKTLRRGDTRRWQELFRTKITDPATGVVTYEPRDISGLTFLSQIRATTDSADVMAVVACSFVTDGTDGLLQLNLTAAESAKLVPGKVAWDLQSTDADGDVRTWLAGTWKIQGDVSR